MGKRKIEIVAEKVNETKAQRKRLAKTIRKLEKEADALSLETEKNILNFVKSKCSDK